MAARPRHEWTRRGWGASHTVLVALVGVLVGLLATFWPGRAAAAVTVPAAKDWVTDLAGQLTPSQRADLSARLEAFEKGTGGKQIFLLIVPSLDGEAIEDLAIRAAKQWKPGQEGKDTGVLLVSALAERRFRVEVGKGLEGDLTDLEANQIISKKVAAHTKPGGQKIDPFEGRDAWYQAYVAAIHEVELKIAGKAFGPAPLKPLKASPHAPQGPPRNPIGNLVVGFVFALILLAIIVALTRRRGGGGPWGGGGGFYWGGGGYGGGGGWGGGGGGSDGGGFSGGGGGDFGGGGASDDV